MYVESLSVTPDRCETAPCELTVKAIIRPTSIEDTEYTVTLFTRTANDTEWLPLDTQTGTVTENSGEDDKYIVTFSPITFTKTGGFLLGAKDASEENPDSPIVVTVIESVVTPPTEPISIPTALISSPYTYIGVAAVGIGLIYILADDKRTSSFQQTIRDVHHYVTPKLERGYRTIAPVVKSTAYNTGKWVVDKGIPAASRGVQSAKTMVERGLKKLQPRVESIKTKANAKLSSLQTA